MRERCDIYIFLHTCFFKKKMGDTARPHRFLEENIRDDDVFGGFLDYYENNPVKDVFNEPQAKDTDRDINVLHNRTATQSRKRKVEHLCVLNPIADAKSPNKRFKPYREYTDTPNEFPLNRRVLSTIRNVIEESEYRIYENDNANSQEPPNFPNVSDTIADLYKKPSFSRSNIGDPQYVRKIKKTMDLKCELDSLFENYTHLSVVEVVVIAQRWAMISTQISTLYSAFKSRRRFYSDCSKKKEMTGHAKRILDIAHEEVKKMRRAHRQIANEKSNARKMNAMTSAGCVGEDEKNLQTMITRHEFFLKMLFESRRPDGDRTLDIYDKLALFTANKHFRKIGRFWMTTLSRAHALSYAIGPSLFCTLNLKNRTPKTRKRANDVHKYHERFDNVCYKRINNTLSELIDDKNDMRSAAYNLRYAAGVTLDALRKYRHLLKCAGSDVDSNENEETITNIVKPHRHIAGERLFPNRLSNISLKHKKLFRDPSNYKASREYIMLYDIYTMFTMVSESSIEIKPRQFNLNTYLRREQLGDKPTLDDRATMIYREYYNSSILDNVIPILEISKKKTPSSTGPATESKKRNSKTTLLIFDRHDANVSTVCEMSGNMFEEDEAKSKFRSAYCPTREDYVRIVPIESQFSENFTKTPMRIVCDEPTKTNARSIAWIDQGENFQMGTDSSKMDQKLCESMIDLTIIANSSVSHDDDDDNRPVVNGRRNSALFDTPLSVFDIHKHLATFPNFKNMFEYANCPKHGGCLLYCECTRAFRCLTRSKQTVRTLLHKMLHINDTELNHDVFVNDEPSDSNIDFGSTLALIHFQNWVGKSVFFIKTNTHPHTIHEYDETRIHNIAYDYAQLTFIETIAKNELKTTIDVDGSKKILYRLFRAFNSNKNDITRVISAVSSRKEVEKYLLSITRSTRHPVFDKTLHPLSVSSSRTHDNVVVSKKEIEENGAVFSLNICENINDSILSTVYSAKSIDTVYSNPEKMCETLQTIFEKSTIGPNARVTESRSDAQIPVLLHHITPNDSNYDALYNDFANVGSNSFKQLFKLHGALISKIAPRCMSRKSRGSKPDNTRTVLSEFVKEIESNPQSELSKSKYYFSILYETIRYMLKIAVSNYLEYNYSELNDVNLSGDGVRRKNVYERSVSVKINTIFDGVFDKNTDEDRRLRFYRKIVLKSLRDVSKAIDRFASKNESFRQLSTAMLYLATDRLLYFSDDTFYPYINNTPSSDEEYDVKADMGSFAYDASFEKLLIKKYTVNVDMRQTLSGDMTCSKSDRSYKRELFEMMTLKMKKILAMRTACVNYMISSQRTKIALQTHRAASDNVIVDHHPLFYKPDVWRFLEKESITRRSSNQNNTPSIPTISDPTSCQNIETTETDRRLSDLHLKKVVSDIFCKNNYYEISFNQTRTDREKNDIRNCICKKGSEFYNNSYFSHDSPDKHSQYRHNIKIINIPDGLDPIKPPGDVEIRTPVGSRFVFGRQTFELCSDVFAQFYANIENGPKIDFKRFNKTTKPLESMSETDLDYDMYAFQPTCTTSQDPEIMMTITVTPGDDLEDFMEKILSYNGVVDRSNMGEQHKKTITSCFSLIYPNALFAIVSDTFSHYVLNGGDFVRLFETLNALDTLMNIHHMVDDRATCTFNDHVLGFGRRC